MPLQVLNVTLLQEIKCYEDALNLYETMENTRSQLEIMLQAALAQVQHAMREVQTVEDQIFEADIQAGRARTIIRKCGFADILQRKNCKGIIKITESNCTSYSLYLTFQPIHITQLDTLRPLPDFKLEELTSLSLWTNSS
jgi:hypothetical protein